ncbi:unnamed protein product [Toxocara canis]|uniref:Fucosyltransferase n=1 Tax=Toxocara canis TaxID=6265 RepID=A0A183UR28_TOXCA|nr:unnamed protein product [Toxocara canis]
MHHPVSSASGLNNGMNRETRPMERCTMQLGKQKVNEVRNNKIDDVETEFIMGQVQLLEPSTNRQVLVLAWTRFFEYDMAELLKMKGLTNCKYMCTITTDRRKFSAADAVVFHVRDMNLTDLPQSRSDNQTFVFFIQESPYHTGYVLDQIPSNYFNITMTYRLDSDVRAGYGWMSPIDNTTSRDEVWRWNEVEDIVEGKSKSVLQMVSNCATESKRELYVSALAQHIEVTEYGRCGHGSCDKQCEQQAIAQHYFYLAFENSVCRDYVTEKLFRRMEMIIVPVVLKRSIASSFLPNGSFIAADDFDSPRNLADYLKYLQNNKREYLRQNLARLRPISLAHKFSKQNRLYFSYLFFEISLSLSRYFEWTKAYKKKLDDDYGCSLCEFLHTNLTKPRVISEIKDWWFSGGACVNDYALTLISVLEIMGKFLG